MKSQHQPRVWCTSWLSRFKMSVWLLTVRLYSYGPAGHGGSLVRPVAERCQCRVWMLRTQFGITVNACLSRESARIRILTSRADSRSRWLRDEIDCQTAPITIRSMEGRGGRHRRGFEKERRLRNDNYQWRRVINRAAFSCAHAMYNRNGSFLFALYSS